MKFEKVFLSLIFVAFVNLILGSCVERMVNNPKVENVTASLSEVPLRVPVYKDDGIYSLKDIVIDTNELKATFTYDISNVPNVEVGGVLFYYYDKDDPTAYYMVKILEVVTNEKEIVLVTTQATLLDILPENVEIKFDDGQVTVKYYENGQEKVAVGEMKLENVYVISNDQKISVYDEVTNDLYKRSLARGQRGKIIGFTIPVIDLDGYELYKVNESNKVWLPEAHLKLYGELGGELIIEWGSLKKFELYVKGELDSSLVAELIAKVKYNTNVSRLPLEFLITQTFPLGYIIIGICIPIKMEIGASISIDGFGRLKVGAKANGGFKAGLGWENNFYGIGERWWKSSLLGPEFDVDIKYRVVPYVKPSLGVIIGGGIWGLEVGGGVNIGLKPYLDIKGEISSSYYYANIDFGVDITASALAGIRLLGHLISGEVNLGKISGYRVNLYEYNTIVSPKNLTATSLHTYKVGISWGAVSGANYYEVYRSLSPEGSYELIGTTSGTSFVDYNASIGSNYYKVRAYSSQINKYSLFSPWVVGVRKRPEVIINSPVYNQLVEANFSVSGSANANDIPIKDVYLKVEDNTTNWYGNEFKKVSGTTSWYSNLVTPGGEIRFVTLKVFAVDVSNNTSLTQEVRIRTGTVDVTPPSVWFTCSKAINPYGGTVINGIAFDMVKVSNVLVDYGNGFVQAQLSSITTNEPGDYVEWYISLPSFNTSGYKQIRVVAIDSSNNVTTNSGIFVVPRVLNNAYYRGVLINDSLYLLGALGNNLLVSVADQTGSIISSEQFGLGLDLMHIGSLEYFKYNNNIHYVIGTFWTYNFRKVGYLRIEGSSKSWSEVSNLGFTVSYDAYNNLYVIDGFTPSTGVGYIRKLSFDQNGVIVGDFYSNISRIDYLGFYGIPVVYSWEYPTLKLLVIDTGLSTVSFGRWDLTVTNVRGFTCLSSVRVWTNYVGDIVGVEFLSPQNYNGYWDRDIVVVASERDLSNRITRYSIISTFYGLSSSLKLFETNGNFLKVKSISSSNAIVLGENSEGLIISKFEYIPYYPWIRHAWTKILKEFHSYSSYLWGPLVDIIPYSDGGFAIILPNPDNGTTLFIRFDRDGNIIY